MKQPELIEKIKRLDGNLEYLANTLIGSVIQIADGFVTLITLAFYRPWWHGKWCENCARRGMKISKAQRENFRKKHELAKQS